MNAYSVILQWSEPLARQARRLEAVPLGLLREGFRSSGTPWPRIARFLRGTGFPAGQDDSLERLSHYKARAGHDGQSSAGVGVLPLY